MDEIKQNSHVVVTKNCPIDFIVGLTGVVESIQPNDSKYVKNMVKFDVPIGPLGVERYWFSDDELEIIHKEE